MLGHYRRVLLIGAHPDDEDTELLTLLVRGYGRGGGVPLAQPRRGGAEPDRARAGRSARAHSHRGAARRPPARRRAAVLHPGLRLRLLQDPRGDVEPLAAGHDPEGRGAHRPAVPAPDHRLGIQRHAAGRPRPAPGGGVERAWRRSGPRETRPASPSSSGRKGSVPGPRRSSTAAPGSIRPPPPCALAGGRARSGGRQVVPPDRHGGTEPAPFAGHGAAAAARAVRGPSRAGGGPHRPAAPTACSPGSTPRSVAMPWRSRPDETAEARRRFAARVDSARARGGARRRSAGVAAMLDRARRELEPRQPDARVQVLFWTPEQTDQRRHADLAAAIARGLVGDAVADDDRVTGGQKVGGHRDASGTRGPIPRPVVAHLRAAAGLVGRRRYAPARHRSSRAASSSQALTVAGAGGRKLGARTSSAGRSRARVRLDRDQPPGARRAVRSRRRARVLVGLPAGARTSREVTSPAQRPGAGRGAAAAHGRAADRREARSRHRALVDRWCRRRTASP